MHAYEGYSVKIVCDLSAAAFIAAVKRICVRRIRVNTLTSDNAADFKAVSPEFKNFKDLLKTLYKELSNFVIE